MSKRWKTIEFKKCRELGGERTGPTGRDLPDCKDVHVGIEIKRKKKLVWLTKDWQQAKENAEKLDLVPVLAVQEHGRGPDMVQLHTAHWLELEIGAAADCFVVSEEIPTIHHVDGDEVARMPWAYFLALYNAYYRKDKPLG